MKDAAQGLDAMAAKATGSYVWRTDHAQAQHVCLGIPADEYIWLNEVEPKKFWAFANKVT